MTVGGEVATRCREYIAANDFAAAEHAIAELSAVDGGRAEADYLKAMLDFRRGDYKAAAEAVNDSLALNSGSMEALELKVRILSVQGDVAGAADLAEQMMAREPGSIGVLNVCAKALAKAGRVAAAAGIWSRIAEIAPGDPAPLLAIATLYFKAKSYPEACDAAMAAFAREHSLRAITLAAESAAKAKDLTKLSVAATDLAELDGEAAVKYMRTLMTPDHITAAAKILLKAGDQSAVAEERTQIVTQLVKAARNAEKAGDDGEAAIVWTLVLQLDPEHSKASSSLRKYISGLTKSGIAVLESGEVAEAVAIFQKLVTLDPSLGTVWRRLAVALNRQSDFAGEAEAWRRLAHLTGDADAWQRALRAIRKCEPSENQLMLFVDARAHLEDAALAEKGDSLARKLGKGALQRAGEEPFPVTFRTLEAIKAWDPESPVLEKIRARLASGLQRGLRGADASDEERTEAAERLLTIDPANLAALGWLSRIYFRNRRFEAASAVYEKLIELSPENESYWHYLGRCRKALKKPDLSAEFANKQAELHPNGAAEAYLEEAAAA